MPANSLKPSQAIQIIEVCINNNLPCFLWGAPGVGKSAIVRQVADKLALAVIDLRAALLDPVDLRGIPSNQNGKTSWLQPDFLPTEGNGVLFLDELPQATESVQSALLQLVLDRRLGDYTLPDGWNVIAAGNRISDGTFSRKLSKALGSRFATHIEIEVDLKDWCEWAIDNGISPEVIAFARFRPELLHSFDPKAADNSFPCPRVWATVSQFIGKLSPEVELAFLAGALGEGAATEFYSFLRICRDLPSVDEILLDPAGTPVPSTPSVQYALCGAVARHTTVNNAPQIFSYMTRIPVEFQAVWLIDTIRQNRDVTKTSQFRDWAIKNGDLLT